MEGFFATFPLIPDTIDWDQEKGEITMKRTVYCGAVGEGLMATRQTACGWVQTRRDMGGVIFGINCIIMAASAAMFGVAPAMYTLISMFMSATLTDKVVAGFNHKKVVILISDSTRIIAEGILSEVGRGVTFLDGEGAFLHQKKQVLFVVASLTQIARIKDIANAVDPDTLMIVMDSNEVMGRGFTLPGIRLEEMLRERNERMVGEKGAGEKND